MTTVEARRTRRATEAFLDAMRRTPGFSVPQLAIEVKRLNIELEILETLRDAVEVVIADARPARSDLDPEAWGPPPTAAQLVAAREVQEQARQATLADALEGALTREQAAVRLGVTAQAVSERTKAGKLTAIRRGREWRFPVWQFSDDDALPGLAELITAWPGTPLALSTWAVKPTRDLGGHTPAQELARRGGAKRVLDLVHVIAAAAW